MSRTVEEWIGKNDDSMPPPRVRLRILESHGFRCYLSGREITPADRFELDHKVALINGGENRESNLAPVLPKFHKQKTAQDVAIKAKDQRIRKKHWGIKARKYVMPGSRLSGLKKKLDGSVEKRPK